MTEIPASQNSGDALPGKLRCRILSVAKITGDDQLTEESTSAELAEGMYEIRTETRPFTKEGARHLLRFHTGVLRNATLIAEPILTPGGWLMRVQVGSTAECYQFSTGST